MTTRLKSFFQMSKLTIMCHVATRGVIMKQSKATNRNIVSRWSRLDTCAGFKLRLKQTLKTTKKKSTYLPYFNWKQHNHGKHLLLCWLSNYVCHLMHGCVKLRHVYKQNTLTGFESDDLKLDSNYSCSGGIRWTSCKRQTIKQYILIR